MRLLNLIVIALVVVPMAAGCEAEPDDGARVSSEARQPLFGIVETEPGGPGALARIDPRTLRSRSRGVPLRGHHWSFSRSPNGDQAAIGVSAHARVQFVDVRRWRSRGLVHAGARGERTRGEAVTALAWTGPRRVLALLGARPDMRSTVVVIDPLAKRVVKRTAVTGAVVAHHPTRLGLAVLVGPQERIGPSRLALIDADGNGRMVALHRIRSGFVYPQGDVYEGSGPVSRHSVPGLAVDEQRRTAFVVSADAAEVGEVDLNRGNVAYRALSERTSLLARLRDLVEPVAEAKGPDLGSMRTAHWLGNGTIAVTGEEERLSRGEPRNGFGLRLIDTRDWTIRKVGTHGSFVIVADRTLLVSGPTTGVIAYDREGRQVFRRFEGASVGLQAKGRYAYASIWRSRRRIHQTFVLRLPGGRIVHTVVASRPLTLLTD